MGTSWQNWTPWALTCVPCLWSWILLYTGSLIRTWTESEPLNLLQHHMRPAMGDSTITLQSCLSLLEGHGHNLPDQRIAPQPGCIHSFCSALWHAAYCLLPVVKQTM